MRLYPSSPKPPSQGMISGYPKGPLGVRWATCFGNRTIVHRQTFRLVVEGCSKIDFCKETGRIMKCWFCDSDARGTCAACGRGLCHQHAHIHDEMTFTKTDTSTGYTSYYNVYGALKCSDCRLEWKSNRP